MILYISNATAYSIYDELFDKKMIKSGYQMQKFNSNLIIGLSEEEDVVALSPLPYDNVKAERFDKVVDGVRYIGIKNSVGYFHKVMNLVRLFQEGRKIIKKLKPDCIICDAIALSPCIISRFLGKVFHLPVIGIITDLPGMLNGNSSAKSVKSMQHFDGYVLLTEQMNEIVNPENQPYIVMEGLCAKTLPEIKDKRKNIILYCGSLWKKDAGIEYFVEGFLNANLKDIELHLYGTGELVPWLESISKKNPNVKYMGCVTNSEIVKAQTESLLLVNPRPSDEIFCRYSFPSKTIEYMASGTPVLMTKLPGVPKEYFDYVYVIEQENATGACEALKVIFAQNNSDIISFGIKARSFVSKYKSSELQCGRILDLINVVLMEGRNERC